MARVVLLANMLLCTGIIVCKAFVSKLDIVLSWCLFWQHWCDFFLTLLRSGFWVSEAIATWSVLQNVQVAGRACQPRENRILPACSAVLCQLSLSIQALTQNSWVWLQVSVTGRKQKVYLPKSQGSAQWLRSEVISRPEEPKNIPFSFSYSWKPHSVEALLKLGDA